MIVQAGAKTSIAKPDKPVQEVQILVRDEALWAATNSFRLCNHRTIILLIQWEDTWDGEVTTPTVVNMRALYVCSRPQR